MLPRDVALVVIDEYTRLNLAETGVWRERDEDRVRYGR